jgi:hypothetical protein
MIINPTHFYEFYKTHCEKYELPVDTFEDVLIGLCLFLGKCLDSNFIERGSFLYQGQLCKGPYMVAIPSEEGGYKFMFANDAECCANLTKDLMENYLIKDVNTNDGTEFFN